jgi:hypothetical protein
LSFDPIADGSALVGAGCLVGGVGWIYRPAGLILLGLLLILVAAPRLLYALAVLRARQ